MIASRLPKPILLAAIGLLFGFSLYLGVLGRVLFYRDSHAWLFDVVFLDSEEGARRLAWFPLLLGACLVLWVYYKMWKSISEGDSRIAPAANILLLLLPVFNVYWSFHAVAGFPKAYNRFTKRHGFEVPRLPSGLFVSHVVLCWLPLLIAGFGLLVVLTDVPPHYSDPKVYYWEKLAPWSAAVMLVNAVNLVVGLVMVSRICDAVNRLPNKEEKGDIPNYFWQKIWSKNN